MGTACNQRSRPKQSSPAFDKSASAQALRREAIDDLIKRGVFEKVETPGSLPRVWVRPLFYALDFDQKATVLNVVYGYYHEDKTSMVRVFDSKTGKEVGTYSLTLGLEMR